MSVESAVLNPDSRKGNAISTESECSAGSPAEQQVGVKTKVAYVMSRFPKLTETFVLFEMLALERHGAEVEVFPLLRARNSQSHPEGAGVFGKFLELFRRPQREAVMHPEAEPYVRRAHFASLIGLAVLWANLRFAARHPLRYFGALWTLFYTNLGSLNYLAGGVLLFPKVVFFANRMQQNGVSHIHAHFANHPAAAAHVIHRLTDISYSFTAHGSDLQVDQHMLREKVALAKHVITISHVNRTLIEDVCGEQAKGKVRIVRCGVDTSVFREKTHRSRSSDVLNIVCTGTFYEVKGHRYLIEACRLLHDQKTPVRCHLIGDGPLLEQLQEQVRAAGLTDDVVFVGRLTQKEIALRLRDVDVAIAPSVPTSDGRKEGIPVVLMEAMASGLPVIASDISGIPELVEHEKTGLLVPPRDPRALAQAILRLSSDVDERTSMGRAARAKVLSEFDLNKNAAELLNYFREEPA